MHGFSRPSCFQSFASAAPRDRDSCDAAATSQQLAISTSVLEGMSHAQSFSVRARTPWWSLAGVVFIVLLTLGNAAANMIPYHIPTKHELQQQEQDRVARERRARILMLLAAPDRCNAQTARELARLLVFDGRSARAYADDYERRCGADPIVRRWGDAPVRAR